MELQTEKKGNTFLVTICEKRFDAELAPEFIEKMKTWINEGEIRIVLNLSLVDFVDSTALGVMIKSLKWIKEIDNETGELSLCGVNDKVMSLLKLTRMDRVFPVFLNCEEALSTLDEPR